MNIYKSITTLCLISLSFVSCDKENQLKEPTQAQTATKAVASVSMKPLNIMSFKRKGEARAIQAKSVGGGAALNLALTYDNLRVRWVTFDQSNEWQATNIAKKHTKAYDPASNMGEGYTILNNGTPIAATGEGNQLFVSYDDITGTDVTSTNTNDNKHLSPMFKAGQFAYMVVGGTVWNYGSKERELKMAWGMEAAGSYQDNLRNQVLHEMPDNKKMDIAFPVMTQATPITLERKSGNGFPAYGENVAKLPNPVFKARGAVLAFILRNQTGYDVKVKSLVAKTGGRNNVENTWFYRGHFNAGAIDYSKAAQDIPFEGVLDGSTGFDFFDKDGNSGINIAKNSNSDGRFFLWGYPREEKKTQPLYLQLTFEYTAEDGILERRESTVQKFNAPQGGWQDGYLYVGTIDVTQADNPIIEYIVTGTPARLKDYEAEQLGPSAIVGPNLDEVEIRDEHISTN